MKKQWWHDKVAYQIYPKSFCDSNGDGIGDLKGIISKLDYLKELGIDIIWISPVYCSPMVDQGYDISDYYGIDPIFGTMEDMEQLLREAKKRNLYILMDLVINHCSDQHEWFQKAIADLEGKYRDYFYIKKGKDGKEPNNWRSYFGGSVWEPIGDQGEYYLHLFDKSQPDLNWENPVVREQLYKMVNWWLEKGLAGFRIDAIINIKKELEFKDYPADREDGRTSLHNMLAEVTQVGEFLTELRDATFRKYNAFTVAEVFDNKPGELEKYIGEEGYFSTIFDFSIEAARTGDNWYQAKQLTPEEIKHLIYESQEEALGIGLKANILENHDEPRAASSFFIEPTHTKESITMLGTIQLFLRGIPFIYQGQEIGMTNTRFTSIEEVDDVASKDQYQVALQAGFSKEEALTVVSNRSRDNSRTPFQWNGEEHAGFTTGTPWIALNPNYKETNVERQSKEEDSILNYYKKAIALRKNEEYKEAFVYGDFKPAYQEVENVLAFYRIYNNQKILVIANYQEEDKEIPFNEGIAKVLLNNHRDLVVKEDKIMMHAYQAIVLKLED